MLVAAKVYNLDDESTVVAENNDRSFIHRVLFRVPRGQTSSLQVRVQKLEDVNVHQHPLIFVSPTWVCKNMGVSRTSRHHICIVEHPQNASLRDRYVVYRLWRQVLQGAHEAEARSEELSPSAYAFIECVTRQKPLFTVSKQVGAKPTNNKARAKNKLVSHS